MIFINENITKLAAEFISFFEGRKNKAYRDGGGVLTIGIGSTENVTPGMIISDYEIDARFKVDLTNSIKRVNKNVSVKLTDNEAIALISQAFNLNSFEKLADHLNQDKTLYRNRMLLYNKDKKGNIERGLIIRRIAERLIFENRDWKSKAVQLQKLSIPEIEKEANILFTHLT